MSLFFLQAKQTIPDPHGLLKGSGTRVRHIVLDTAVALDDPRVLQLMSHAIQLARVPFDPHATPELIIKSISAKQRPRRPALCCPTSPRRQPGDHSLTCTASFRFVT